VVTPNREPNEWLALMADPPPAQSAVDRPVCTAHELVVEDESYRRRQRPTTATNPVTKTRHETSTKDASV
jgi:hypothetical protein